MPAYEIVAEGRPVMVTVAVTVPAAHPAEAGYEYVTVYVPAEEVDGVTAPVLVFMLNPAGEAE